MVQADDQLSARAVDLSPAARTEQDPDAVTLMDGSPIEPPPFEGQPLPFPVHGKEGICAGCQPRLCCYHFGVEVTLEDVGAIASALEISPELFLAHQITERPERTFVLDQSGRRFRLILERHPWLRLNQPEEEPSAAPAPPAVVRSGPTRPALPEPLLAPGLDPSIAAMPAPAPAAVPTAPLAEASRAPLPELAPPPPPGPRACCFLVRLPTGPHLCGLGPLRPMSCRRFPASLQQGVLAVYSGPGCVREWTVAELDWAAEVRDDQLRLQRLATYEEFLAEWNQRVETELKPDDRFGFSFFVDCLLNRYQQLATHPAAEGQHG